MLCSAHSPLEALRALNTAGTSKQATGEDGWCWDIRVHNPRVRILYNLHDFFGKAPPTNGHVKLPKGNLAVLVGCDGDVWEERAEKNNQ